MAISKTLCFCLLFLLRKVIAVDDIRTCAEENNKCQEPIRGAPKPDKLLLVQILFRHADRAPVLPYKTNPNSMSLWEEGYHKLTKLGRKQHYALGKYLHDRYKEFANFSPNEVEVTSTTYDRTLVSAESHLAGLFAPPKEWMIAEGLNWQPIPIHTRPKVEERFLLPLAPCPRAAKEADAVYYTPEGKKFLKKHEETFRKLSEFSGENIRDIEKAVTLFDTIWIEKRYGFKVPEWIIPLWTEMEQMMDEYYGWCYKSPVLKRLRTGPLIKLLIDNMKRKIDGESPDLKFHVFSGHDHTLVMVLLALDSFNEKQPPYAATVLCELHGMTDGTQAMRLLYLNSTEPEKKIETPHVFTIPGCSEYCPIDYIVKYVNDLVIDEEQFHRECSLEENLLK